MPGTMEIIVVIAVCAGITFALRAVPFAVLGALREKPVIQTMAGWMPAGILFILVASTFRDAAVDTRSLTFALIAVVVTVAAHLLSGRRTLVSVGLGTLTYVALINLL